MSGSDDLAAEIERLTAELTALSYSISHDLRAPLRSIEGFSEALAEDYQDKLDDRGLDYLRRIRGAVAQMETFINSLLELARVSREEMRREPVDISALAESIAVELKASDPARRVIFSIAPGLTVQGDAPLLRLALDHLLGNSWKFTSKRPTASIEVGSEERDGQRILYVRDDGAGFDPPHAGRMFSPFQRFHSSAEFEGTGMGLAIVQRIVSRHGGRVWATGKVQAGTTVYIALR